jgi:hypothetical protein
MSTAAGPFEAFCRGLGLIGERDRHDVVPLNQRFQIDGGDLAIAHDEAAVDHGVGGVNVGACVSHDAVSSSVGVNEFVLEIRVSIQTLINNEKSRISSYPWASFNRMDALEIVISGGGVNIPILC